MFEGEVGNEEQTDWSSGGQSVKFKPQVDKVKTGQTAGGYTIISPLNKQHRI